MIHITYCLSGCVRTAICLKYVVVVAIVVVVDVGGGDGVELACETLIIEILIQQISGFRVVKNLNNNTW